MPLGCLNPPENVLCSKDVYVPWGVCAPWGCPYSLGVFMCLQNEV